MTNLIRKPNFDPKSLFIFFMMIMIQVDHFLKVLNLAGINSKIKGVNCILLFFFSFFTCIKTISYDFINH